MTMSNPTHATIALPEKSRPAPPKISGLRPLGSSVLIEILSEGEAIGTNLHVTKGTQVGAPQAYIVSVGAGVKLEDCGFKIGDRVVVQGTFVPLPNYDKHDRMRGIVELHNLKCVLLEEKTEE
jgi:co-chaperonin GroES (HSP10)